MTKYTGYKRDFKLFYIQNLKLYFIVDGFIYWCGFEVWFNTCSVEGIEDCSTYPESKIPHLTPSNTAEQLLTLPLEEGTPIT